MPEKSEKAPISFLVWIFILFAIVSVLLYWRAFEVKPSVDDFTPPLADIQRGQVEGPLAFFRSSQLLNYRPLDSLLMWTFGSISSANVLFWIHVMHFLSFWFFAYVICLWINILGFNRLSSSITLAATLFHPVMAAPVASIDGSSRILVSAFVWLAAYFLFKYLNRNLLLSIFLSILCFIIALGFMEYGIQFFPLAILIVILRAHDEKYRKLVILIVAFLIIFACYIGLRAFVAEQKSSFLRFVTVNPLEWLKNWFLAYTAIFFYGNTVWVKVNQSVVSVAWFLVNVIALGGVTYFLLKKWLKSMKNVSREALLTFRLLFFAFLLSCIPIIFLKDMTEIYLSCVLIPFSLLLGFASNGIPLLSRKVKIVILLFVIFQVSIAIPSIQSKITDIIILGERAEKQVRDILEFIPDDAENWTIGLFFKRSEIDISKDYSIFRVNDIKLIQPTFGHWAMDWYSPNRNLKLLHLLAPDISRFNKEDFDLLLKWDYETHKPILVHSKHALD